MAFGGLGSGSDINIYITLNGVETVNINIERLIQNFVTLGDTIDTKLMPSLNASSTAMNNNAVSIANIQANIDKFNVDNVTENIKIDRKVEYIVNDDLKAAQAVTHLYENKQDVYKINNILAAGTLGTKKKLVPTRWSITAVDDMVGKKLIEDVKNHSSINNYLVFSSEFLGNHFEILMMPGNWEFENFEEYAKFLEDYESIFIKQNPNSEIYSYAKHIWFPLLDMTAEHEHNKKITEGNINVYCVCEGNTQIDKTCAEFYKKYNMKTFRKIM